MAVTGGRWHVEGGVAVEEADRLEPERRLVDRHHRPLLGAGDVMYPEHVPQHDVHVLDCAVLGGPHGQPAVPGALYDELAARPALVLAVRGDPQRVLDRPGALEDR